MLERSDEEVLTASWSRLGGTALRSISYLLLCMVSADFNIETFEKR